MNTFNSLHLVANDGYKCEIDDENNKKQEINCILPLFSLKDKELEPIITHDFYHLLMTHNVTIDIDRFND